MSAILALGAGWHASPAYAGEDASPEELKATFLYNFFDYMKWPPGAHPAPGLPPRICVIGDPEIAANLHYIAQHKQAAGSGYDIQKASALKELQIPLDGCHIVYIDKDKREDLTQILSIAAGKPILTVSNREGFARQGGGFEFFYKKDKLALRINRAAVKAAGISVNPKLLALSDVINGSGEYPLFIHPKLRRGIHYCMVGRCIT